MNKTRLYAVNRLIDGVFIIRVYNAAKTLLVVVICQTKCNTF